MFLSRNPHENSIIVDTEGEGLTTTTVIATLHREAGLGIWDTISSESIIEAQGNRDTGSTVGTAEIGGA